MTQIHFTSPDVSSYRIVKIIAFLYGMVAYIAFFVTILYAIGFVMGIGVPKTIDSGPETPAARGHDRQSSPDVGLRRAAQRDGAAGVSSAWWTQDVPKSVERSTYRPAGEPLR